ncbi:MAG: hypothetical protein Q8N23_35820 [Archangium sp.]|nr:hypothetical protein [Archangium sp.]MDP3158095.1 hypothetical protein [Archangium sp.]MDP3570498.1 hypothetical protein [Archangium sp.]
MSSRWWVAALLLGAACSNGFWACGGGGSTCCSNPVVKRDQRYVGSIPAADGGTPTRVEFMVTTNSNSRVTFVREGVEIEESFSVTSR